MRFAGRSMGGAVAVKVDRHTHPKARPEPETEPVTPSGISFMRLLRDRHEGGWDARISYAGLAPAPASDQDGDAVISDNQDESEKDQ